MADYSTPSRPGAENDVTGTRALDRAIFLEVFAGMVLEAFDTKQVAVDKHLVRTISHGKSAQFPLTWKGSAAFHTPGAELDPGVILHDQRILTIENLLVSSVFVDKLDDAMNHYEIRKEYAHQLGEALANIYDTNVFRAVAQGADASHPFDSNFDGTELGAADLDSAAGAKGVVYDGAQTLDENDVPEGDRYLACLPSMWYVLLEDGEFIDRDFAGEGSKARATIPFASDLQVLKTNNIPTIDDTATANVAVALQSDYLTTRGVIWQKGAIGTVKLLDLSVEDEYSVRHKGTLLTADYAIATDFLRTEACIWLTDV